MGTHQCLVYANVNLLGKNINTDVDVLEVLMVYMEKSLLVFHIYKRSNII
jgi:hypothetical protein